MQTPAGLLRRVLLVLMQGSGSEDPASRWEQWAQDQVAKARHEGRPDGQLAIDWVRQMAAAAERLKARASELDAQLQAATSTVQVRVHGPGYGE